MRTQRTLPQVFSDVVNTNTSEDESTPRTAGSHSFSARALVALKSASSSLRDSVSIVGTTGEVKWEAEADEFGPGRVDGDLVRRWRLASLFGLFIPRRGG